jgi:branched-chain amino acid transport system ATP-binding protein
MSAALLEVDSIHTYYGESHVLQGVSLAIPRGGMVSLMGRNGAGKTTTLRSIMRLTPPRQGTVRFDGRPLGRLKTYQIAQAGIALVPETRGIFPSLSVQENLTVAARGADPDRAGGGTGWTLARIYELFPRLAERRDNGGAQLSGGEQQMLAIARALLTNPSVLLLDEPGEGLAPIIVQEIYRTLEALKAAGTTMLLVEKNLAFATGLSDRVYVLGKGQIRWSGTGAELRGEDEVKHTWLGV